MTIGHFKQNRSFSLSPIFFGAHFEAILDSLLNFKTRYYRPRLFKYFAAIGKHITAPQKINSRPPYIRVYGKIDDGLTGKLRLLVLFYGKIVLRLPFIDLP